MFYTFIFSEYLNCWNFNLKVVRKNLSYTTMLLYIYSMLFLDFDERAESYTKKHYQYCGFLDKGTDHEILYFLTAYAVS